MDWKIFAAAPLAAALLVASAAPLSPLNGWSSGSMGISSKAYQMGIDNGVQFQGQRSVSVQSQEGLTKADSHGAVIQNAFGYQGRRVRFSGWMRSADVKQWAGAFLRVDAEGTERFFGSGRSDLKTEDLPFGAGSAAAQDRWVEVSIVADVPNTPAAMVSMGAMVVGEGKVWLSAMRFEEVGPEVPVTSARIGMPLPTSAQREAEARRLVEKASRRIPPNLSLE
ncbi:hypothetical protein [Roseateles sp.]|uniref:hypothetical protein n=1 Tax=Roseateles sp. TaxID=1971397 RepID=UPI0025F98A80|nr:hypothetical protein [Roseateles sp.]MBV8034434.1 hypothetical protein [Roseateles sp.]